LSLYSDQIHLRFSRDTSPLSFDLSFVQPVKRSFLQIWRFSNCLQVNKYRITAVLKVETDIIASITTSPIGWAVILMISVDTFKTDVIA